MNSSTVRSLGLLSSLMVLGSIHAEIIDFNQFSAGDFVSDLGYGVSVTASMNPGELACLGGPDSNLPMIFDSANPTGDDFDLGAPHKNFGGPGKGGGGKEGKPGENDRDLGNLLIISEDCVQEDPDDSIDGGAVTFSFDEPKPVRSIGLLDFEKGTLLEATLKSGAVVEFEVEGFGNNGFTEYKLDVEDVVELVVTFRGSGGIAFLDLNCKVDPVGAYGDPHYKMWNKAINAFHGICDLVMLQHPDFEDSLGLNIHLRTELFEKNSALSIIKAAAVQIGNNVLEVVAGKDNESGVITWTNGSPNAATPTSLSSYPIHYRNKALDEGMLHVYTIDVGDCDGIVIKSFPHLVDVRIRTCPNRLKKRFGGSAGLLGNVDGELEGRNGQIVGDFAELGASWQVRPQDPELFRFEEGPQFPQSCAFPGEGDDEEEEEEDENGPPGVANAFGLMRGN